MPLVYLLATVSYLTAHNYETASDSSGIDLPTAKTILTRRYVRSTRSLAIQGTSNRLWLDVEIQTAGIDR